MTLANYVKGKTCTALREAGRGLEALENERPEGSEGFIDLSDGDRAWFAKMAESSSMTYTLVASMLSIFEKRLSGWRPFDIPVEASAEMKADSDAAVVDVVKQDIERAGMGAG